MTQEEVEKIAKDIVAERKPGRVIERTRRLFATAANMLSRNLDIACRAGCCACCWTMPVVHSNLEQTMILQHIAENKHHSRTRLQNLELQVLLQTYSRTIKESGYAPDSNALRDEWDQAGFACPALVLPEGTCLIYEARPLECHMRISTQECYRPIFSRTVSVVPQILDEPEGTPRHHHHEGMFRYMGGLIQLCRQIDTLRVRTPGASKPLVAVLCAAVGK